MQVSVKTTSGLGRAITVAVPSESFEAQVAERVKAAAGQAKLPGFRPGKVPLKEIHRRFGATLRQEVAADLMQSSFNDAVRQEQLSVAGQASVHFVNTEPGRDLEYTATFEVFPTFQLADLSTLRIGKPEAEISEDDVDDTVATVRHHGRRWHSVERAAKIDDRVVADYSVKVEGEVVRELKQQRFVVGDPDNSDALNGVLVGIAASEKRIFPTTVRVREENDADHRDDHEAAAAVEAGNNGAGDATDDAPQGEGGNDNPFAAEAQPHDADEAAFEQQIVRGIDDLDEIEEREEYGENEESASHDVSAIAEIAVHAVEEGVLPELDDEFFDSYGVEEGEDRYARFREQVRERMQIEFDNAIHRETSRQVRKVLAGAHDFELPRTLVDAELANRIDRMREMMPKGNPEVFEDMFRAAAVDDLRAKLVLEEVIRQAHIEPDDQRVLARIEEIANTYEEAAEVRRWLYGNEDQLQRIERTVAEQQAVEYVLSQANTVPLATSYKEVISGMAPELAAEEADAAATEDNAAAAQLADAVETAPAQPAEEASPAAPAASDGAGKNEPLPAKDGIGSRVRRFFGAKNN